MCRIPERPFEYILAVDDRTNGSGGASRYLTGRVRAKSGHRRQLFSNSTKTEQHRWLEIMVAFLASRFLSKAVIGAEFGMRLRKLKRHTRAEEVKPYVLLPT